MMKADLVEDFARNLTELFRAAGLTQASVGMRIVGRNAETAAIILGLFYYISDEAFRFVSAGKTDAKEAREQFQHAFMVNALIYIRHIHGESELKPLQSLMREYSAGFAQIHNETWERTEKLGCGIGERLERTSFAVYNVALKALTGPGTDGPSQERRFAFFDACTACINDLIGSFDRKLFATR